MSNFPKKQILINYLLGICTPGELEEVEEWLDKEPGNVGLLQQLAGELGGEKVLPTHEKEEIKQKLFQEIEEEETIRRDRMSAISSRPKSMSKPAFFSGPQLWLKVAAIVLVIVTAGFSSFYFSLQYTSQSEETISLQQRNLSNGQTATLRFGDGSVIRLNGGSTLRYPKQFAEDRREVYLEGEAFFSIARDESRPFIVHTAEATTRVLGTSFNVKAYNTDDQLQVAVAEGRVAVSRTGLDIPSGGKQDTIILQKNQWVTYRSEGRLVEKGEGNIWEMIAWKDNVLVFNNKTFEEVARMLERWYGVEIRFEAEELKNIILQGEHKDISLEGVLNSIQYVTGMEYVLDGEIVVIKKGQGH